MIGDAEGVRALAERVEGASEGDTMLDRDTALALGWRLDVVQHDDGLQDFDWIDPAGERHSWYPFATRSLDAAMTLLPARDWEYSLEWQASYGNCDMLAIVKMGDPALLMEAEAATPALALTAACLRAIASSTPPKAQPHEKSPGRK